MTKDQRLPPGMTPRLLTAEQAAAYCGIGRENFEARVGVPPLKLFGNRVLYDRAAIDRWLDEQSGLALSETAREDWLKHLK
jgi:predicted DNA-binding transcriptional regulator AlpA